MPVIPTLWEAKVGDHLRSRDWDHPGQHGETPSLLKIQKISWAWWQAPVIPATQEVEAGELQEPGRWRLPYIRAVYIYMPIYTSLKNWLNINWTHETLFPWGWQLSNRKGTHTEKVRRNRNGRWQIVYHHWGSNFPHLCDQPISQISLQGNSKLVN